MDSSIDKNLWIEAYKNLYVPYHPRAKRLYKTIKDQLGINCIYKKTQTLGEILTKKGRQIQKENRKNTVYRIPCAECPKKYVGQTTKPLHKRNKEHENWCKTKFKKKLLKSTKKNDGIAYHHHYTGHKIDFNNVKILAEQKKVLLEKTNH